MKLRDVWIFMVRLATVASVCFATVALYMFSTGLAACKAPDGTTLDSLGRGLLGCMDALQWRTRFNLALALVVVTLPAWGMCEALNWWLCRRERDRAETESFRKAFSEEPAYRGNR